MKQVLGAVTGWEAVSPEVSITVSYMTHEEINSTWPLHPDDDTIYLQRMVDGQCVANESGGICSGEINGFAGITRWISSGLDYSVAMCVNADELDTDTAQPFVLQGVVAHELGHAMGSGPAYPQGLWHVNDGVADPGPVHNPADHPVSIMTTWHENEPANGLPTCLDANNLALVRGLAPVACESDAAAPAP